MTSFLLSQWKNQLGGPQNPSKLSTVYSLVIITLSYSPFHAVTW